MGRMDTQACLPACLLGEALVCLANQPLFNWTFAWEPYRARGAVLHAEKYTCYMSRGQVCGVQVKLRGFRVELGEVEAALGELPGVLLCAAVVLLDPVCAQRLVAYVTPATLDCSILASELKGRLPAHMVPSIITPLEVMPLLPNEKINRKVGTAQGQPQCTAMTMASPLKCMQWLRKSGDIKLFTHRFLLCCAGPAGAQLGCCCGGGVCGAGG